MFPVLALDLKKGNNEALARGINFSKSPLFRKKLEAIKMERRLVHGGKK